MMKMSAVFVATAVVLATSVLVSAGDEVLRDDEVLVTEQRVAEINAKAKGGWTASTHQGMRIEGATVRDVKRLLGAKLNMPAPKNMPRKTYAKKDSVELPASFDSKDKWPQCPTITHIRDQSACGSCWAEAATESMSDRYCTYGKHTNLSISARDLMSCCWYCGSGCQGGQPSSAWSYWVSTGITSTACQPYPFPKCCHHVQCPFPPCPSQIYPTPQCSSTCTGNSTSATNEKHKGSNSWTLQGETDYMNEVYKNGPFEVAFSVYSDFPTYKGGVYKHTTGSYLGGHAVKLVGWGELNGEKYWKIANSWNKDWGVDGGYFLIARGVDECGIEQSGAAGQP